LVDLLGRKPLKTESGEPPAQIPICERVRTLSRYPCITLLKAKDGGEKRTQDRYSAGLHHLALCASSRDDVDALYAKPKKYGANILDSPVEYPGHDSGSQKAETAAC